MKTWGIVQMKPFTFKWLLQFLVTVAVVVSQIGAPVLALAKREVDTRAKTDQVIAGRHTLAEKAITPEKMARILQNLAQKLPGEGEARRSGERAAALIAADYAAMMSLPAQAARRPFQQEIRLTDAEFPQATPGEVSAALGWLLMGFLNLPASVTDVERQDLGSVLEMGMTALGLHYQVLALRQAMTAGGADEEHPTTSLSVPIELSSPITASRQVDPSTGPVQNTRPAQNKRPEGSLTEKETGLFDDKGLEKKGQTQHDKKKGVVLQTRNGAKKVLQSLAAVRVASCGDDGLGCALYSQRRMLDLADPSPIDTNQPQESRVFGNIRVTANVFMTVDGGVMAVGNVSLGASANSIDTYRLPGEYNSVVIKDSQLTGSGTLVMIKGGTSLFNGSFSADTSQPTPIITPKAGAQMLITSMGVFPLQGAALVDRVNLLSGWAEGQAKVLVTPPGITQTIGISYTLQPGTIFTGTVSDFSLNLSGTNLAVSGALLTNDLIQAAHYMLTLPAELGGNSKQGDLFTLLPKKFILAGSEGAVISLPDINLDLEGSKVRLENALASLGVTGHSYLFQNGHAVLNADLPENTLRNIATTFTLGPGVSLKGTISGFKMNVAGMILDAQQVTLDGRDVTVQMAELTAPEIMGGLKVAVYNAGIVKGHLVFGEGRVTLPEIIVGDGKVLKILNVTASLMDDGQSFTFIASGTLDLNLPENAQQIQMLFNIAGGKVSGSLNEVRINLAGCTLSIQSPSFQITAEQGQFSGIKVARAQFTLPKQLSGASIWLDDISIGTDGLKVKGGLTISLPDIDFGSQGVVKITNIKAVINAQMGVYWLEATGDLTVIINGVEQKASGIGLRFDTMLNITGKIDSLDISLAGLTLGMKNLVIDLYGLSVDSATLAFPKEWGGASAIVKDVAIHWYQGVSIGCAVLTMPDFQLGKALKFSGVELRLVSRNNQVTFTANVTLTIKASEDTDPLVMKITLTIGEQASIKAVLNPFQLKVFGSTIDFKEGIILTENGINVDLAVLTLPPNFGVSPIQTSNAHISLDGLMFDQVYVPYIKILGGEIAQLLDLYLTVDISGKATILKVRATLDLKLPGNHITPDVHLVLDSRGVMIGEISNLKLNLAGCILQIDSMGVHLDGANDQLYSGLALLILPTRYGDIMAEIKDVRITRNGLEINQGIEFRFPDIKLDNDGRYQIKNIYMKITSTADRYILASAGATLVLSPEFGVDPIPVVIRFDRGEISGEVTEFQLNISGWSLKMKGAVISFQGLHLDHAELKAPDYIYNFSTTVDNVWLDRRGLTIDGGIKITLSDIPLFNGKVLKLLKPTATITQQGQGVYTFTLSATLWIKLPGNDPITISVGLSLDTKGQFTVFLKDIKINLVKDCWIEVALMQFNSDQGLYIKDATLKLPQFLNNARLTINEIFINDEGLTVRSVIHLGDFDLKVMKLKDMNLVVMAQSSRLSISLGLEGNVYLHFSSVDLQVAFSASIDTNGTFSGIIKHMELEVGGGTLILDNVQLRIGGGEFSLYTGKGYLHMYVLGHEVTIEVERILIDQYPLWVHFDANPHLPLDTLPVRDGVRLGQATVVLTMGEDQDLYLNVVGEIEITMGGATTTAPVSLVMNNRNQAMGVVGAFELPLAGMTLQVSQASVQGAAIAADQATLTASETWGGGTVTIYNLRFENGILTINNGAPFVLPNLQTGGFQLRNLHGVLIQPAAVKSTSSIAQAEPVTATYTVSDSKPANAGYSIQADGWFGVPGLSNQAGCSPLVNVTLSQGAGQNQMLLSRSQFGQDACSIPIGFSGLGLEVLSGKALLGVDTQRVDLTATVTSHLVYDSLPAFSGAGLQAGFTADPASVDVSGTANLYNLLQGAQVQGRVEQEHLVAQLHTSTDPLAGDLGVTLWNVDGGQSMVGSGILNVTIAQGGLWQRCALDLCSQVPAEAGSYALDGQLGNLPDGSPGLMGQVGLTFPAPFTSTNDQAVHVAAGWDAQAAMQSTNLISLMTHQGQGVALDSPTADTTLPVTLPVQSDALFILVRSGTLPTFTLTSPSGVEYTPVNLGSNLGYQESILADGQAVTYTQAIYGGAGLEAGRWLVRVHGVPEVGQAYHVEALQAAPAPVISEASTSSAGAQRARLTWRLTSVNPATRLNVYANPLTSGVDTQAFVGFPVASNLTTPRDGSQGSLDIDLSSIRSGVYRFWLEAVDGQNTPVRRYASGSFDLQANWQAQWDGNLSLTAGYRQLLAEWSAAPNADTDGYRLQVTSGEGISWTVQAGSVLSAMLTNLKPGILYTVTLQAYRQAGAVDEDVAQGGVASASPSGAPFTFTIMGGNKYTLNAGQTITIQASLQAGMQPYPEAVGLTVGPSSQGIVLNLAHTAITPSGVIDIGVSAGRAMATGVYTATLRANGPGEAHEQELTLTVNEQALFLDVVPGKVTLHENETRSATIGVTARKGANWVVSLVAGMPADGLVMSLAPNPVQVGLTTTLYLTDTSLLPIGQYTIPITATDGVYTAMTQVQLEVIKSDYVLEMEPLSRTAQPGQTVSYTLGITNDMERAAWEWPVRLELASDTTLPPGSSAGLRARPGDPLAAVITTTVPNSVTLEVSLPAGWIEPSGYWIDVIASSQGVVYSDWALVLVPVRYQAMLPVMHAVQPKLRVGR